MERIRHCLTIAGSDCSGGAGIQADIKTFSALGCYGMSVITAVVAENTARVLSSVAVPQRSISDQLEAVFSDIRADGVKIGMLPNRGAALAVAEALRKYSPQIAVCDPVMIATAGAELMDGSALSVLVSDILPLCTLLTPNIPEAETLTGMEIRSPDDMKRAAEKIHGMGARYVLVKGGHLDGAAEDILYDGKDFSLYSHERIDTNTTHGTGCTLSSAITAYMARGSSVYDAVREAKSYLTGAIAHGLDIGQGHGPANHFYRLWEEHIDGIGEAM